VTIEWWHIWANEANIADPFQQLADEYMAENPNVEVVITTLENEAFKAKIATVMQSGEPPDVFQTWGGALMGSYADAGLLMDLTPYMAEDGWGDSLSDGAKALFQWDGKQYAAPWRAGMVGMWYNKEHFATAGIDAPPATWAELLDAIDKLKAAGITPIAIGEGNDAWTGMFWYASLLMNTCSPDQILAAQNRTGAFNDPCYVQAGELLEELVAKEPFQEGFLAAGYADAEALMATGGAAMQLMGHWAYGFATTLTEDVDAYNDFIGWFPFPRVEGTSGDPTAIFGGGDSFAIGINAPPETVDFVKYLTSAHAQQLLVDGGALPMPVVTEGVTISYPVPAFEDIDATIKASSFTLNYLDHQFPPPLNTAINEEVQVLFAGMATGQDVADNLEALAVENLD
jgi:raffinose/stachyose/melibiose transport system substrate-binding protein